MQFTETRFRSTSCRQQSQTRCRLPTVFAPMPNRRASRSTEQQVDQQMDAWLKEARSSTRIQFKKEAFQ